tara:strand:+ start:575 stop:799 length:225 start_codon:yes stop_codon:yes gene_type:complete
MKMGRKKLTNKDFENRDNILMMEVENLKRIVDSMFMTIVDYIEYNDDVKNLEKFMENKYKENDDVQTKLQKSGS